MPRYAATLNALEKGVGSMSPDAALKIIQDWETQLGELDSKGAKTIVKDLGALRKELEKGDKMNGEKVGELTAKLGQETTAIADEDEKGADKLRQIGESLSSAG